MTIQDLVARNPRLNATLDDGHRLQTIIRDAGMSANPRLYGNLSGGSGFEVPETSTQSNDDLPDWATNFADGTTLDSLGLAQSQVAVYLQVWVAERQNFYDVAQVLRLVDAGVPLEQALN